MIKNSKMILIETLATLAHDNVTNLILAIIAITYFDIDLSTSFTLWGIGQIMNFSFSYIRRSFFLMRYMDK